MLSRSTVNKNDKNERGNLYMLKSIKRHSYDYLKVYICGLEIKASSHGYIKSKSEGSCFL